MAQQLPPEVEQLLAQTPDPQDRFEIMLNYNRRQNPAEFDRQLRSGPMAGRVKPDANGWLTFKAPHESWLARNSWILGAAGLGTAAVLGLAGVGAAGAAGTLPSTTIGSGFIPAIAGPASGTGIAAGSGMGAAAGAAAAALPSETVGLGGSGFGGNALAGSGFGEPLASRQVGSGAMGPVGQGRAGAPVAPSIGSSSGRLGRGIKALAGSVPAIAGLTGGGDGGSPSQGLNELLQQIPQLREMLDLQLNQAKRQDPLHEAVTKMSMNLLPNSARKSYS